jgi:cystathionine beta-lyase
MNPLVEKDGHYSIDYDDLEVKMKDGARMMVLCSPHNPVGRCWNRGELEWLGAKALEYNVLMISDEIHCDLVFEPHQHTPMATLSDETAKNTITCIAPSKTFNLAGLFTSSVIIPDDTLREQFRQTEEKLHLSANMFGITAAEAAYRHGEDWLDELMEYLKGNADLINGFLKTEIPEITSSPLEATYLLWLDFRKLGIPSTEVNNKLIEHAGLGLVDGVQFGSNGKGFQRMNFASPKKTILEALERLKRTVII